jgi:hypothetical protein
MLCVASILERTSSGHLAASVGSAASAMACSNFDPSSFFANDEEEEAEAELQVTRPG